MNIKIGVFSCLEKYKKNDLAIALEWAHYTMGGVLYSLSLCIFYTYI